MAAVFSNFLGGINLIALVLNTLFWCGPLYAVTLIKIIIPHQGFRRLCTKILLGISENWVSFNSFMLTFTQKTNWEVHGLGGLSYKKSYIVASNHRSWVDIVVLQKIFNRKIPFIRFFLKSELKWLPLLGGAFWALDFPFMKRYSKSYLERHPEKKGKDLETTQKICRRVCSNPVSFVNFLEGTRFRQEKHDKQKSPYQHHLRPKAGGLAYVLEALEGKIGTLLDVTIIYPNVEPTFWSLLSGKIKNIIVLVKEIEIPMELRSGNYTEDAGFRSQIQDWVNQIWEQKDHNMVQVLNGFS